MELVGALAGGGAHTEISLSEMLKMLPKMTTSVLRPGPLARRHLRQAEFACRCVFPFSLVVAVVGRYFLYPVQAKLAEKIALK